jgi:hypothetical protein
MATVIHRFKTSLMDRCSRLLCPAGITVGVEEMGRSWRSLQWEEETDGQEGEFACHELRESKRGNGRNACCGFVIE